MISRRNSDIISGEVCQPIVSYHTVIIGDLTLETGVSMCFKFSTKMTPLNGFNKRGNVKEGRIEEVVRCRIRDLGESFLQYQYTVQCGTRTVYLLFPGTEKEKLFFFLLGIRS